MSEPSIVLFDGVCNFCNASVNFIMARDPMFVFRFAPLQSDKGREFLQKFDLSTEDLDTMVLIQDGRAYTRSTAALRIAEKLTGLWPMLYAFIVVPRFIRDGVYKIVAKNRYKWWGKKDSCRIPTPEDRARFLTS